ncbi:MAG: efflux RND transporter periplasmic adaptor subunit [Candidatus Binatia bacterium]
MFIGRVRPSVLFVAGRTVASLGLFACVTAASAADDPKPVGDAVDGVSSLGRIEPEHGILRLGAPSTPQAISGSLVHKLLVQTGDDVVAGQILAETDSLPLERANVDVATAELELAERQAEMAVGDEQEVCSRAEVASRTAARRADLLRSGVTSSEEADVAAGDAKALSGGCSSARIATTAATSRVAVARARLARENIALERCVVRAPTDGRVLRILRRPGELIDLGGLLLFGRVKRMYAVAEIYETDIRRVRAGQKATVTSPALEAPLTGVVEHIRLEVRKQDTTGTDPAARKDARIVEVEVLLDEPEAVAGLSNLQVEVVLHP